jgi:autonomous glycyl radical cofactor GrcA
LLGEIDIQRHADDGLDAGIRQLVGELQRAEEVVGVGQAQRRQLVGCSELGKLRDRERTLEQRIGRVDLEVHEFRRPGGLSVRGWG